LYNILVSESARRIRQAARDALRGQWKRVFCAYMLYVALMNIPTSLLSGILGGRGSYSLETIAAAMADADSLWGITSPLMYHDAILGLFVLIISGPLSLGISMYALTVVRGGRPGVDVVMAGFNSFGKAVGLHVLMLVFVFLWSLLLVIPGIIALFAYALAFFILADNPGMGAAGILGLSRRMMRGNKMKLLVVLLSLIGWAFLTYFALYVVSRILSNALAGPALDIAMAVLRCPIVAPLDIYLFAVTAVFYEFASGRRRQTYSSSG
jgi:uncharacterized membrane protein